MKTKIKTIILSVACVFPIIIGTHVHGQSYTTSAQHTFHFFEDCDTSITRTYKDTTLVTCANLSNPDYAYSACFTIREALSPSAKILYIPHFYTPDSRTSYKVSDVRILDDICYFCGTQTYTPYNNEEPFGKAPSPASSYKGFIGHFSIIDALSGSGSYYLEAFDEVSSFSKMAVTSKVDSTDVCILLIGNKAGNPDNTCLTSLSQPQGSSNQWKYYVTDTQINDEIFTDVIVTDDFWVTASIFKENEDFIGLRGSKITNPGFYDETFNSSTAILSWLNIANDLQINRHLESPVLLCPMYNNQFNAGLSGSHTTPPGTYSLYDHTYIMRMDCINNTPSANNIYCDMYDIYRFDHLPKSIIKDLTYIPDIHSTAVLYDSPQTGGIHQNFLIRINWATPKYCDTIMYMDNGRLYSLDTYRGGSIAMGGLNNQHQISDIIQRAFLSINSCLKIDNCKPIAPIDSSKPDYITKPFQWIIKPWYKNWQPYEFLSTDLETSYCTH